MIYGLNTHLHADHITGTGLMKRHFPKMKSVLSSFAGGDADWHINEGDLIRVGDSVELQVIATPGHTDGCVSYVTHKDQAVFTGDALLIRGCGRTDFQSGTLKISIRLLIFVFRISIFALQINPQETVHSSG